MPVQSTMTQWQAFQERIIEHYGPLFAEAGIRRTFKDLLLYLLGEGEGDVPLVVALLLGREEILQGKKNIWSSPPPIMHIPFRVDYATKVLTIDSVIRNLIKSRDSLLIQETIESSNYSSKKENGTLIFEIFPGEYLCISLAVGCKILALSKK